MNIPLSPCNQTKQAMEVKMSHHCDNSKFGTASNAAKTNLSKGGLMRITVCCSNWLGDKRNLSQGAWNH